MWDKIKRFFSEHPYGAGAIVFVVGLLVVLYYFRGKSSGGGSSDMAAYYQAAAAATASGNQLQIAQVAAQVASTQSNNQLAAIQAAIAGQEQITNTNATAAETVYPQIATINATATQNLSTLSAQQAEYQQLVQANTLQELYTLLLGAQNSTGNLSPTGAFPTPSLAPYPYPAPQGNTGASNGYVLVPVNPAIPSATGTSGNQPPVFPMA